jgi:hypothetical protein
MTTPGNSETSLRDAHPVSGPASSPAGCYRVLLPGGTLLAWGPIVDADNELGARDKANALYPGVEPVTIVFLHPRGGRPHTSWAAHRAALEAKASQAFLLERRRAVA